MKKYLNSSSPDIKEFFFFFFFFFFCTKYYHRKELCVKFVNNSI